MNLKLLSAPREFEGHSGTQALDGVIALEMLERDSVDVLISDIFMPHMDGYRLCHEVRKNTRLQNLPIIIYTATYTSTGDEVLALSVGADKYLRKPASIEAIVASLHDVCATGRPAPRTEMRMEVDVLKEYSDRLVTKLEDKNRELAKANSDLKQSNEQLQQFAYVASHDLQSPLRSISGFVQLLQSTYATSLDDQGNEWIRRTVQSTQQMQALIRDVLAFSSVDSQAKPHAPTSLGEVVLEAVSLLESAIRESEGRVSSDDLPTVMGDRAALVQLMQNLIGNGLKYHGKEPPHVHVSARPSENQWVISVRDNGIGIDPKHYERIFEIFRRLHNQEEYPGTGIGLAVCRRVVQRHGGSIWVESQPGQGSTFNFSLRKEMS